MKFLVDSDYIADYLKGREASHAVLNPLFPEGLGISIITFAEVYDGIYYGRDQAHYARVFQMLLRSVKVVPLTRRVATRYAVLSGELRAKGMLIDQPDLFIAATAIQHNLTLVTRNLKHYERVPGLVIYKPA